MPRVAKKRSTYSYSKKGSGLFSYIKSKVSKFHSALRGRPKALNELMNNTQGVGVLNITVCRKPINSVFQKVMNVLSLGKVNERLEKEKYDALFHLYAVFSLGNGETWLIEKNERVTVNRGNRNNTDCEPTLFLNDGKDIKTYIENLEKLGVANIYEYNSTTSNCQDFIKKLLNSNGIGAYDKFILQNVANILPDVVKNFSKLLTDVAAVGNVIINGGKYQ